MQAPAADIYRIRPSDAADLPRRVRGVWIPEDQRGGTVRVTTLRLAEIAGGSVDVPARLLVECDVIITRIWASGTTVAEIWGRV
jgi:hypothetical protein